MKCKIAAIILVPCLVLEIDLVADAARPAADAAAFAAPRLLVDSGLLLERAARGGGRSGGGLAHDGANFERWDSAGKGKYSTH